MTVSKSPAKDRHRKIVQLAARQPDLQTIEQLRAILDQAINGKVAGLMFAVHYGGREYSYLCSGSMCHDPSIGIAAAHRLATKLLHANK